MWVVYSVQHAARLTGISADTLRMWERRYAVVEPLRSAGGHRRYDDDALRRLSTMRALVAAGWSPGAAAAEVIGGGEAVPAATASPARTADALSLVPLARDLDPVALDRSLGAAFAAAPFEDLVDTWLMPALVELGAAWEAGTVTVGGEHFVSAGVHRHVANVLRAAEPPADSPRVVVGLARSSRHELGVLSFAAVLRRAGIGVVYVGSDLPTADWVGAVTAEGSRAAVLGVPTPEDVPGVRDAVAALAVAAPDVPVYVGGAHQDRIADPVVRLGHQVVPAARTLVAALA